MQPIGQFLQNKGTAFEKLISKTRELQYLNRLLAIYLEENLAKHCFLTKIDKDQMFITVESSAWATKLRYDIPEILKNIQSQPEFKGITKIKYSISPSIK